MSVDARINIKQLYCHQNSDCTIVVWTVPGSALVYNCRNCTFTVSAHQVRIHGCENCTFVLHAGSSPIIEDSTGLKFREIAPDLVPEVFKGKPNHCSVVQDFNWQKKEKSPNWVFEAGTK